MNRTPASYPEGSIWRKWDLQVQTRLDKQYKCLGSNTLTDEELEQLASVTGLEKAAITSREKEMPPDDYAKLLVGYITTFTDISVIAVTDHNDGKELDALIAAAEKTKGKLTILPGVEVSSNHGIHILCIFNPKKRSRRSWADTIEHFLTQIRIPLERFGKNDNPLSAEQSSQEILEHTEKVGGLCVFAHICTENGLFKTSATANGGTAHIDIYKNPLCNIVQIPSNGSIPLGVESILSGRDSNYGKRSVTRIKCSDSRSLKDIGESFTWIKADPTFEGLSQIIIEPTARTSLEDSKPDSKQPYQVIDSFSFEHPSFIPEVIPLNRNLVTIIGGKSTGKSLLLYSLAKTADPDEVRERIEDEKQYGDLEDERKYGDLEDELDLSIQWGDNRTTALNQEENRRKVTYIPQNYLNQLSDPDNKGVRRIVNKLFLQQPSAKIFMDTFSEEIREKKESIAQYVQRFFNMISDIEQVKDNLKELGDQEGIEAYINRLEKEIEKASKSAGFSEKEIEERHRLESKWEALYARYSIWQKDYEILNELSNSRDLLIDFSEAEHLIDTLSLEFKKPIAEEISALKMHIESRLEKVLESQKSNLKESWKELYKEAKKIVKPLKEYRKKVTKQTALKEKQNLLKSIQSKLRTFMELDTRQRQLEIEKNQTKSNIIHGYTSLHRSYKNLCDNLNKLHNTLEDIDISILPSFNTRDYQTNFVETYIDRRADKSTTDIWNLNYDINNPELHFTKVDSIFKAILNNSIKTRGEYSKTQIITNLFSNRFHISYWIRYQNDSFTRMSPGKRGLVLLKLLVDLDQNTHPILLDQPEDDLDSRSIYRDLVEFIRKRKCNRQIIVVTHNPNLVVGADAEQVIVANQEGEGGSENKEYKFEYVSGSIENSYSDTEEQAVLYQQGIREHICEILEGGEEAFKKREKKYAISN